jgi:hypothetical protein
MDLFSSHARNVDKAPQSVLNLFRDTSSNARTSELIDAEIIGWREWRVNG